MDRADLLSNPCFTRSAGFCDAALGHLDACSSFSLPVGPAQADRALDDPNLALRVCYGSSCVFNALPMVPPAGALTAVALGPERITKPIPASACRKDSVRHRDERQETPTSKSCARRRFDV